eukprot:TRINITY_DN7088_c0_g1_i1.p1 TRINITY_DN7088_c0_g1~~TRINITY_DN7088_c0_g1_i1.p1  ORF type:complete len:193 (+),score=39.85 TRINITY_DN7088_c0_g1_i1:220-798(+)
MSEATPPPAGPADAPARCDVACDEAEGRQRSEQLMRRAIALAASARAAGNHPFGALLYDPLTDSVVLEAENTVHTEGDVTRHAELNAISWCHKRGLAPPPARSRLVLYTSTEPCAMCAGALYWGGVRRVVFGLPGHRLSAMVAAAFGGVDLDLNAPCREVLAQAGERVEVQGPLLESEAEAVHEGFWGGDNK